LFFASPPANHGRSAKDRGKYNLLEKIEKADAPEAQLDKDIAAAEARGACQGVKGRFCLFGMGPSQTQPRSGFRPPRRNVATGPVRTFATLSSAAVQLHQTGHSLRAQNRELGELEICGQRRCSCPEGN